MYKVLLVEDDPLMSNMYQRVFAHKGLEVEHVGNGQAGLDALKTTRPDIILADIMMPMMNGVEMVARIKADPATSDIPVMMLTNLSDLKTAEEAVTKGAVRYFIKSKYDPDQIADAINEVLSKAADTPGQDETKTDDTTSG